VATEQETLAVAAKSILDYDVTKAEEIAKEGLASGIDPITMLEKGFILGITEMVTFLIRERYGYRN